ncbi:hypothetical protein VC83_09381 [Pseudogymnoascus destructans]|uniref:Major facilitator superfamily (MFS) profile domain-containing protein n=1 Tax=Pseudogymnoascus destructans TaxID=655981 RepID=A0A177A030_9PEZI|nr:uncharacterized protein VC83_09381 [Pseudogymnoascus destructans]OAF54304.1 hypothetical protein VC83_09381 [Pseudogymnoascus destructans]
MSRKPIVAGLNRRQSSTPHYQTFPTAPPRTRGNALSSPFDSSHDQDRVSNADDDQHNNHNHESPLPRRQLAVLAIIALAEQTALNSISPYLPQMVASFPSTDTSRIGLYVGAIASSFAAAQLLTNYFWGSLSDRIGRKPVILLGAILTAAAFVGFGFCTKLWHAILVQAIMGIVNGNQGLISTCLGEITDRSNQGRAFVWLPVIYGVGAISGPALGGLLVQGESSAKKPSYPFLLPNLVAAVILVVEFTVTLIFLEESLEEAKDLPPLQDRVRAFFSWMWQFASGAIRPTYTRRAQAAPPPPPPSSMTSSLAHIPPSPSKDPLSGTTLLLLSTYFVFQLSNASFNALYPVFAFADPPLGRNIPARDIGFSLSAAGVATIMFQVLIFGRLRDKMGNKATYRAGLGLFAVALLATPTVPFADSKPPFKFLTGHMWMWAHLSLVLLAKTVASVGGLSSALLLITNSAPEPECLGALNGLAQTLSSAGRGVGPVMAGGLFSAAPKNGRSGGWIPFGVFGGVAVLGFVASWGIRGEELEGEEWDEGEHDEEEVL